MSDGLFNPEAFEQMPGQMSMACHSDIPPRWLDELDAEMREYADEFEVAHCPTCGGDEKEPKCGAVLVIDHAHIEIMKRHGARMDRAWRGES